MRAPKRLLSPSIEDALTARQLEVLDSLDASVLRGDFADLTMAEIAKRMTCSLRTLYDIAPSKDALLLAVADRQLQRVGREAMETLELELPPLERLRAYLRATNLALQPKTVLFTTDFGKVTGAPGLAEAHTGYIVGITRTLLDEAVEAKEIRPVDTGALAFILGRLGREFARPELKGLVQHSARQTADSIAEIILNGLTLPRAGMPEN
ncbi:MAG: TetR/AcrR family transcriptional regulator [Myxococcota bacterium]